MRLWIGLLILGTTAVAAGLLLWTRRRSGRRATSASGSAVTVTRHSMRTSALKQAFANHLAEKTLGAVSLAALAVLGATTGFDFSRARPNSAEAAEDGGPTTTTKQEDPVDATPEPKPAVMTCTLDLGTAAVGAPLTARCSSGTLTFTATPDNGAARADGTESWWAGMVSGWVAMPADWKVTAVLNDGTSELWQSADGGYVPTSPQNDKVSAIRIEAASAGQMELRSCYLPCSEMESAESVVVRVDP